MLAGYPATGLGPGCDARPDACVYTDIRQGLCRKSFRGITEHLFDRSTTPPPDGDEGWEQVDLDH